MTDEWRDYPIWWQERVNALEEALRDLLIAGFDDEQHDPFISAAGGRCRCSTCVPNSAHNRARAAISDHSGEAR